MKHFPAATSILVLALLVSGCQGSPGVDDASAPIATAKASSTPNPPARTSSTTAAPKLSSEGQGPSYDCTAVATGSIASMVCKDPALSVLDRQLADVYAAAQAKAHNEHPPQLQASQRGWIKARDECWKSDPQKACIISAYQQRVAELQARYALVPSHGPVTYHCDDNPRDEVTATYFDTDPKSLVAERGDSTSLMFQQPSASGAKYAGPNETLWEHHGQALVTWGYGAPELHCTTMMQHQ